MHELGVTFYVVRDVKKVAEENNVKKIVVGIPFNMDGTAGAQAQDCKNFSLKIA